MLGRFFRLRLDIKLPFETNRLLVRYGEVEKFCQMFLLPFHVGVEQGHVAFATAPKGVAFAAQFMCHFHRLLHLTGSERKHIGIATRAGTVDKARMRKRIRRAPKQFHAGAFLFFFQYFRDCVEILVCLG